MIKIMHIIEVKQPKQPKPRRRWPFGLIVAVLLIAGIANYSRAVPEASAAAAAGESYPASAVQLAWPGYGQAAVMTAEDGLLGSSGAQIPFATASIAKVITALCVLQKYPLQRGAQGPTITLSSTDVALYDNYLSRDGSVVAVQAGEQITEYQLLEGMLLPSANNLADSAAIWAYGNLQQYLTAANQYVQQHGLTQTIVAVDASGFDPATTSTATDLAKLGLLALQEPVIKQIAAQPSAILPLAGTVYNYNMVLGQNGIIGLKTGNNDVDTGAFLFAANITAGGAQQTIVGAIMGAGSLGEALRSSLPLIASVQQGYERITLTPAGTVAGRYSAPWLSQPVAAKTPQELSIVRWKAQPVTLSYSLQPAKPGTQAGAQTGLVIARSGRRVAKQSVTLAANLPKAGFWWRLTRH